MSYKFLLFALVLLTVCAVSQIAAQEFVTNGLVSFWTFDGNTISGNAVEDVWGNCNGTAEDTEIVPGKINEGLQFNGSSSLVTIVEDASLDITDAITIEAWIKIDVWQADPNRNVIMARYVAGAGQRYAQFSINPDNGLALYIGHTNGTAYAQTQKGGTDPEWVDKWVHVAVTWDHSGDGLGRLYMDGEEIGGYLDQDQLNDPLIAYDIPWIIGAMPDTSRFFSGVMDEVRIYDKSLSATEIQRNFNAKSNYIAVQPAGKLAATWGRVKLCR